MPMNFSVSAEDLLRSKIVKPGLYQFRIESVQQGPGKADPSSITTSVNLVFESDDVQINGIPITTWFSEKAAGLAVEFLEAVSGKKIEQGGVTMDLEQAVGRTVRGHVINEKYQGRLQNKIDGWMPA